MNMDQNARPDTSSSSPTPKRLKLDADDSSQKTNDKSLRTYNPEEICIFGEKCYRRNIHHFREYRHPHLENLCEKMAKSQNFNELPKDYVSTMDNNLLIDQVTILKASGYKARSLPPISSTVTKKQITLFTNVPDAADDCILVESGSDSDADCVMLDSPSTSAATLPIAKNTPSSSIQFSKDKAKSRAPGSRSDLHLTPKEKWEASGPFYLFLTSIGPERTNFSIGFKDLFHKSFGDVKQVCHLNFMVEIDWLMDQIVSSSMWGTPTTIIYGAQNPAIEKAANEFEWMDSYRMKSPYAYGHHHTKMSLIEYEDHSIRFVIYTANLIESDWLNKTQGIWISPKCPQMSTSKDPSGDSATTFRMDILSYLATYQLKLLENWMKAISFADCSNIKVVFVSSAPTQSQSGNGTNGFRWGLKKMETVLKTHQTASIDSTWPLLVQCSSIGSLGPDESWLSEEFANLLEGPKKPFTAKPPVKLVYPCVTDVKDSAEGVEGADCLPYSSTVHVKQEWIERHMCKWVGFRFNRTYALPHIKTYCRVSPDYKQMAWFLLTSSNLSKAAWGKLNKKRDQLMIMSWECGVLLLPKFLTGTDSFNGEVISMDNGSNASTRIASGRQTVGYPFPVPYDLPLHPYSKSTKPWLVDYLGHPRR